MVMVKYLANPPACAFGDLAGSLGGAHADVLAGNGRALSDIAGGVDGVEGDEIARAFPDSLGGGAGALGRPFADVARAAANLAAGAAVLGLKLGGRLGCVARLRRRGLGLAVLAGGLLAADSEGEGEQSDEWQGECVSHGSDLHSIIAAPERLAQI
jgi:hypothetical protein